MSAADWYKPGGPGWQAQQDMAGKTPEEQAAIATATQATENTRRAQGAEVEDFYRNRNADRSEKSLQDRVKATGIGGMPLPTSSVDQAGNAVATAANPNAAVAAKAQASRATGGDGSGIGKVLDDGSTQQGVLAAQQANDKRNLASNGTLAVDPRYAGPGQLTTNVARDPTTGILANVKAPGVMEGPSNVAMGGLPTKFEQGAGTVVDMGAAAANPAGKPLASMSDASFLGGGNNTPNLYDNPAVTQADKTVNGVNRSDLMNAFKDADQKSGQPIPAATAKKTALDDEEQKKKFAAPIKLSLT